MRMPQIMVEAFAKGLIDKIMVEVFDVMDTDNEKLQMLDSRDESADIQSQSALIHNDMYIEPEVAELIEKMVHGLRNLQIGDSASVPLPLSNLENQRITQIPNMLKQVKQAVSNIGSVSIADLSKSAESHIPQGQGDVHQITHDAVIETPIEASCSRKEKEATDSNEATRISVSLLHRLIEELETKVEEPSSVKEDKSTGIGKERIASWEETEEQFIRTIESIDDPDPNALDGNSKNRSYDSIIKESSSFFHSASYARTVKLEEISVEEITPLPLTAQEEASLSKLTSSEVSRRSCDESISGSLKKKKKKKRSMLRKMRKLLRSMFGHRKN